MSYLDGLYAELIDLGPDDGRVVGVTAADIDNGYLQLPRRAAAGSELTAAARWAWDGTVNAAGHYRVRRPA